MNNRRDFLRNAALMAGMMMAVATARAVTYYVSPHGDDTDGSDWEKAFTQIQTAVAKSDATEIIVTNGTYAPISRTDNKALAIRSVNGAKHTIIDGGNTNRCALLGTVNTDRNTVLTGFTLMNGNVPSSATIGYEGAAVGYGTLNNCILTNNTAGRAGGAAFYSTLNNCTLIGNTANSQGGGGACGGILNNCTVVGNKAGTGGGVSNGAYGDPILNNCIVWGNFHLTSGATNNYAGGTFRNSCSTFTTLDNGNTNAPPLFMDAENGDYRLHPDSPCIDAGSRSYTNSVVDLAGNPRVSGGKVDMGAYESIAPMTYGEWQTFYEETHTPDNTNRWLIGLSPSDPSNAFYALIDVNDGEPSVGWTPDLGKFRSYTVMTATNLLDLDWQDVTDMAALPPSSPSRFFRIRIEER